MIFHPAQISVTPQMLQHPYNANEFSQKTYQIAGLTTHVYNSDKLASYIQHANDQLKKPGDQRKHFPSIPVHVLYLVHHRGGDYHDTEMLAYNLLHRYYANKTDVEIPLVCVTFDNRNHGERLISKQRNLLWTLGNDTHALDMISDIDGNVEDLKLIMNHLPLYLNLEYYVDRNVKEEMGINIKYVNGIAGVSLGGHTVVRFALKYPDLVDILMPFVGLVDLSSLLIHRLLKTPVTDPAYDKRMFYYNYSELPLNDDQRRVQYPEFFHKYLAQRDQQIFEQFPMSKIKMFAAFGADDTLVPAKLSTIWCEQYINTNDSSEFFVQPNTGHETTAEMIEKAGQWLARVL